MNIQAEKIELIRLITEIESEKVLKKLKEILTAPNKSIKTKHDLENPIMTKRLEESKKQITEGKGVKVTLDEIWK